MPSLVKPWLVTYVGPDGRKCKKGTPGAAAKRERAKKWYAQGVPGYPPKKRVPLAQSKDAARKMLADLVAAAEGGAAGVSPKEAAGRKLAPLVEEWRAYVARGAEEQHVEAVSTNVNRVLDGLKLSTLQQLKAPDLAERVKAFVFGLIGQKVAGKTIATSTAAYTGKHPRQFTRWLWRKKKLLPSDPLAGMDLPSQKTENPRRPLTPDELAKLIRAAESSPKRFRYLDGPARALVYLTAAATGFRTGELAELTPDHFDLSSDVPTARLPGEHTKNDKNALQPLPPAVAARVREYVRGKPAGEPLWPGTWADRSADMLKRDMAAAGLPLKGVDGEALFHSLRHSYTSMLTRTAPVKVAQELARHSTAELTVGRYSHTDLAEKAAAVARLPLPGSESAAGPFASMDRATLEAVAGALFLAVLGCGVQAGVQADGK